MMATASTAIRATSPRDSDDGDGDDANDTTRTKRTAGESTEKKDPEEILARDGSRDDDNDCRRESSAGKITIDGSDVIDKHLRAKALYKGAGLAPMVRCSTTPLRVLAFQYGAKFCYTEEMVDRSLVEAPNQCRRVERVLRSGIRVVDYEKDLAALNAKAQRKRDGLPPLNLRIDPLVEAGRLICQLGTGDPDWALRAALLVHRDVAAVDVNMGCPKRFSTGGGMGSALLKDPQRACDIIRRLDAHLPEHPVSAKVRLLDTALETVEFASGLVSAGASAIAIHGRRVGDPDTKDADWTTLKEVVTVLAQKFPAVPICINGDFYTRLEFEDFMRETSASAVLLARPALHNTSIFVEPLLQPTAQNGGTGTASPPSSSSSSYLYGYDSLLLVDKTTVVQEYVRNAAKYEAHWKNVKYVVCEMLNIRRTPASRVPALRAADQQRQRHGNSNKGGSTDCAASSSSEWRRPTIGETCACKSLEAMCELWRVSSMPAADGASAEASKGLPSDVRVSTLQHPAGDHNYFDAYILNHVHEAPDPATVTVAEAEHDDRVHPAKRARADS
jgi:tRNA-dihydrouridine synthase 2